MAEKNDLLRLLPGSSVMISGCEASEHGDNEGCLCKMKGTVQVIDRQYESPFVGTPTWHLKGSNKRVRLSEVTFVVGQRTHLESAVRNIVYNVEQVPENHTALQIVTSLRSALGLKPGERP